MNVKFNKFLIQAVEEKLFQFFDIKFAQLLLADSQDYALMLIGIYISAKSREGSTCLPLNFFKKKKFFANNYSKLATKIWQLANLPTNLYDYLKSWHAVSNGEYPTPLVLSHNSLYLHHYWKKECTIANFFNQNNQITIFKNKKIKSVLDDLFGHEIRNYQKIAAAVSLTKKISIISGGPGTGKTTTAIKLLIALIRLSKKKLNIRLAAPTGKAAARLTKILNLTLKKLAIHVEEQKKLPDEATTIHRLLGAKPGTSHMYYNAHNNLPVDVLILDEASMISLSMMVNIIVALPLATQVIFLGDHNQLPSIETGSIMRDLCKSIKNNYSLLRTLQLKKITGCQINKHVDNLECSIRDSSCLLKTNYRFHKKSGIARLAKAVNKGNVNEVEQILNLSFQDINSNPLNNTVDYYKMLEEIIDNYTPFLNLIHQKPSPTNIIAYFSNYQLLCAVRKGSFGVEGLNNFIESILIKRRLISLNVNNNYYSNNHYIGRPVIINRNDSNLGLLNGDIGITLPYSSEETRVFFLCSQDNIKDVPLNRLPSHTTAWVITVHQSQGSEFNSAGLVLPNKFIPLLTRELIYTAITRTCKKLTIYANKKVLNLAIKNTIPRYSNLKKRLTNNFINLK